MPEKVIDHFNVDGKDYIVSTVVDPVPTEGSQAAVQSGGTWQAIRDNSTIYNKSIRGAVFGHLMGRSFGACNLPRVVERVHTPVYANGIWVVALGNVVVGPSVGCGGILYSLNGIDWVDAIGISSDLNVTQVIYHADKWLAASANGAFWSSDGVHWSACTGLDITKMVTTVYAYNNIWFAAQAIGAYASTGTIYKSEDGINFHVVSADSQVVGFAHNSNAIIGVGYNGNVYSIDDGDTWQAGTGLASSTSYSIAANSNIFVAAEMKGGSSNVFYSPDGASWTASTSTIDAGYNKNVAVIDGKFIMAAETSLYASIDGMSWSKITTLPSYCGVHNEHDLSAISSINGTYFISIWDSAGSTCKGMYSSDLINWNYVGGSTFYLAPSYGNGMLVAGGFNNGNIVYCDFDMLLEQGIIVL